MITFWRSFNLSGLVNCCELVDHYLKFFVGWCIIKIDIKYSTETHILLVKLLNLFASAFDVKVPDTLEYLTTELDRCSNEQRIIRREQQVSWWFLWTLKSLVISEIHTFFTLESGDMLGSFTVRAAYPLTLINLAKESRISCSRSWCLAFDLCLPYYSMPLRGFSSEFICAIIYLLIKSNQ